MRIALLGRSGSGKTTVAAHLIAQHGFTRVSTGDVCREVTRILYGHTDRKTMNDLTVVLRGYDNDIWLNAALRQASGDRIVFDSMRFESDAQVLLAAGFLLARVDARTDLRFARLRARGQEFVDADDQHAIENELANLEVNATLVNEGLFDELYQSVDNWIHPLLGQSD